MVFFEGSQGSSWLLETVGKYERVCPIHFEPMDDIPKTDSARGLTWLRTAFDPNYNESTYASWVARLTAVSKGQSRYTAPTRVSCPPAHNLVILKVRWRKSIIESPGFIRYLGDVDARVVFLHRDVVHTSLAEYRRNVAGLGQFNMKDRSSPFPKGHVDMKKYVNALKYQAESLRKDESRRLKLEKEGVSCTEITYEALISKGVNSVIEKKLLPFVKHPAPYAVRKGNGPKEVFRKSSSALACDNVVNWKEFVEVARRSVPGLSLKSFDMCGSSPELTPGNCCTAAGRSNS
jgi:hypothetical protein